MLDDLGHGLAIETGELDELEAAKLDWIFEVMALMPPLYKARPTGLVEDQKRTLASVHWRDAAGLLRVDGMVAMQGME